MRFAQRDLRTPAERRSVDKARASPAATARSARRRRGDANDSRRATLPPTPTDEAREARARITRELEREGSHGGVRVRAVAVSLATLADLRGDQLCGGGDCIAGVRVACDERACAALFAMEAADAHQLLGAAPIEAPKLDAFTSLGAALARACARGLGCAADAQTSHATLEEDSLIAILLRTHAPSSTSLALVELALDLDGGAASSASWRAQVYVLADRKRGRTPREGDAHEAGESERAE